MISEKKNISGLKIPFLATSIIPLEKTEPTATPKLASIIMFLTEIALDPNAEFKKFTASLLTPTTKSPIARRPKAIIMIKYISILLLNWLVKKVKSIRFDVKLMLKKFMCYILNSAFNERIDLLLISELL